MSIAPATLTACLAVLREAILTGRQLAGRGRSAGLSAEQSQQLNELMDVVHNLPDVALSPGNWDERALLDELRWYDEKWAPSRALAKVYEWARLPEGG